MELSTLIRGARVYASSVAGFPALGVGGISTDSRTVAPGDVFVAIDGTRERGSDHIAEAIARGASLVVCERRLDGVPFAAVESARRAAAVMWSNYFGSPADKMTVICVTGTCGKTAVSTILHHILDAPGARAGLIGTLGAFAGGEALAANGESELSGFPSAMTTPDPKYLYGALAEMARRGCRYAVVESSSHAIAQRKLDAITPALAVFTNLSPEHLDFHGDMDSYLCAKARLLAHSERAVLCGDDGSARLAATFVPKGRAAFVGSDEKFDYVVTAAAARSFDGSDLTLKTPRGIIRAFVPLAGDFAVINAALALAAACELGADPGEAANALASTPPMCGRMERIYRGEFTVVRDFAHTPSAMRRALAFARSQCRGRLVCVFGCGGDRDKTKRAPMGRIAAEMCDLAVVTGDNPRTEDPAAIISDILSGAPHAANVRAIPDRREAIAHAIATLRAGDILMLLGKGHETWEIDRTGKKAFDEARIVAELTAGR